MGLRPAGPHGGGKAPQTGLTSRVARSPQKTGTPPRAPSTLQEKPKERQPDSFRKACGIECVSAILQGRPKPVMSSRLFNLCDPSQVTGSL